MSTQDRIKGRGILSAFLAIVTTVSVCVATPFCHCAWGDETLPDTGAQKPKYHTPLAGEDGVATFLGKTVDIPTVDRSNLTSITVGGTLLEPRQGAMGALPVVAFYHRRIWDHSRTRNVVALFVNELEYEKRVGPVELVTHFENYTLPTDTTEVLKGDEIKQTALYWGDVIGSVGPGIRLRVSPGEPDNDFRLQLLGRVGYMYAHRSHARTSPGVIVPPDTPLYGGRIRIRYDGLRRNLLELPHYGVAAGCDLDFIHRDRWRSLTPGSDSIHRNYLQGHGYFVAATGIPGLSERNRLLVHINGGKTSENASDRFNAIQINGGPAPTEADDLIRPYFAGMFYDNIRTTAYATASLTYRRELAFFMYLSLAGSYIWGDRATVKGFDQVVFKEKSGTSATVAIDSAVIWNSSIYLAYTWDSGFIRNGRSGSGVTLLWNKLF
jgi:hypothetical protein